MTYNVSAVVAFAVVHFVALVDAVGFGAVEEHVAFAVVVPAAAVGSVAGVAHVVCVGVAVAEDVAGSVRVLGVDAEVVFVAVDSLAAEAVVEPADACCAAVPVGRQGSATFQETMAGSAVIGHYSLHQSSIGIFCLNTHIKENDYFN